MAWLYACTRRQRGSAGYRDASNTSYTSLKDLTVGKLFGLARELDRVWLPTPSFRFPLERAPIDSILAFQRLLRVLEVRKMHHVQVLNRCILIYEESGTKCI
jgi:hypothetical protein